MKFVRLSAAFLCIFALLAGYAKAEDSGWGGPYQATVYGGWISMDPMWKVLLGAGEYKDSTIVVGALSKGIYHTPSALIEGEVSVGKHYERQDNWEGNVALLFRWTDFWWNKSLPTTAAIGEGLSYASSVPKVEADDHNGKGARFLNHLLFELTFALPSYPDVMFVLRDHHRSGAYGVFGGVHGGSDFLCAGLKLRF